MTTPRIIVNNLLFRLEHTPVSFNEASMSFESLKYGIVGDNGVGKTTFLKLLSGELVPDEGSIRCNGIISLVPQSHAAFSKTATIRDVLGVSEITAALDRINKNDYEENDFDTVAENWDIENRIETALRTFNLWPINLDMLFASLSGGEKTKVLLAKTFIFPCDFILFDEPTNNLDKLSRDVLYHYIESSPKGMLIVSHDRMLLNKMDRVIEITTKGIDVYGGNYDFYKEQKTIKLNAIQQEIQARTESLAKSKRVIQTRMERHQQNVARGRRGKASQIKSKGSYDKLGFKLEQERSEKTNRRIRIQADRKLEFVNKQLDEAKEQLEVKESIDASLAATRAPNNKIILKIEDLCFKYPNETSLLINNFDFQMTGPERVAITGPNGCGKSTLIKLIRKLLTPLSGTINVGVDHIAYLDQEVSHLDKDLNLVDNFLKLNPEAQPFDAYSALAAFKFRNKDAEKRVVSLSGGERMRAGLAISLMSKRPPQLIILDEPTNHLDLHSIEAIESILKLYQGAILAISHDEFFLKNIGVERAIVMKR